MFKRFITFTVIFVAGIVFNSAINGRNLGSLAKGILNRPDSSAITTQAAQKTSTPQLWEYRVVTKYVQIVGGNEDYGLNALGAQGFEVVGVSQSTVNTNSIIGYHLTIVLRRPKQ